MAATIVWIAEKSTMNKNHTDHTFLPVVTGAGADAVVCSRWKMNCTHLFVLSNPFNARSPNDDRWLHVILLFKYYLYFPLYEISIIFCLPLTLTIFRVCELFLCCSLLIRSFEWVYSILFGFALKQTNRANQPISRLTFACRNPIKQNHNCFRRKYRIWLPEIDRNLQLIQWNGRAFFVLLYWKYFTADLFVQMILNDSSWPNALPE